MSLWQPLASGGAVFCGCGVVLNMVNVVKKTGLAVVITVARLYGYWRGYLYGSRINSCKVDDTSKENCSVFDKLSFPLTVEDRLSELPDEVLSYILSLLSLRDVARMATLSRNWRKVCLALPYLDLDWNDMSGKRARHCLGKRCERFGQAYVNRVNQVLQKYMDQNILSFRLVCCLKNNYVADVNQWISFVAANEGLQSLTLKFICRCGWAGVFNLKYDELPLLSGSFLSQCSHLKELHLDFCILKLENDFKLSNLTTLDLNNVILEGTQWESIFSCSSTIECLWLRLCNVPNKLCIGNNFLQLRHLVIAGCSNLQEIELSASNLKNFELYNGEALKCSFLNVPNLESVYLFPDCSAEEIFGDLAANVSSLKYLFLRERIIPLMHKLPYCPARLFYSVLSLRVDMKMDHGYIVTSLPRLLKSFPQLKKLEIKLPVEPKCKTNELPVPRVHTKLEEVELSNFNVKYIPIATYLLKSAVMLDRMVLTKSAWSLNGFESWYWSLHKTTCSNDERMYIQNALIGKASSTSVEVIIE